MIHHSLLPAALLLMLDFVFFEKVCKLAPPTSCTNPQIQSSEQEISPTVRQTAPSEDKQHRLSSVSGGYFSS